MIQPIVKRIMRAIRLPQRSKDYRLARRIIQQYTRLPYEKVK
jgi:hypothetical protein